MDLPLAGVTIIDLTHHVAGPFATRLLAAYGADVIKIERPGTGDPSRRTGPFPGDVPHPERSGRFLWLNQGKRSVTLDLKSPRGRELLLELVRGADALVENFSPGVMPSLGLDWPVLHAANPALVMTSISNFGPDGPYRDYVAQNINLFAAGGQMSLTGEPDREPLVNGGTQPLMQAGLHAYGATTTAIYAALVQGIGRQVTISIQEVQAAALEGAGPSAIANGLDAGRGGNLMRATWGIYPCADGYAGCNCMERNIPNLLNALEADDIPFDPGFRNPLWRMEHNDEAMATVLTYFMQHTKRELLALGAKFRVPFSYIAKIDELMEWPSLLEKHFWQHIDHPDAGTQTYPGPPFIVNGGGSDFKRAPRLGEHTDEVLKERLGLDANAVAELRSAGVVE